jgi:transcriptional regulator with XRE-family HTH domain
VIEEIWSIPRLYEALNGERRARGITWRAVADELDCSAGQLSGLPRIRYAISIRLAMRITRWLDRPACDFLFAAEW